MSAGESKTEIAEITCVQTLRGHALFSVLLGVRVGRRIPAVLGEWRQHDQGVGRGDGRVPADAGGARGIGVLGVRVGRRIAAVLGECDDTIKVWDVATGACLQTLRGHADCGAVGVLCRPTDPGCSRGVRQRRSRCGTWRRGHACRRCRGTRDSVHSVCVLADGSRLFSGSYDNTIKVWNAATGACVQTLRGHAYAVRSVCLSADGSRLFSGSADSTIKVWDAATGACLQTLRGHAGSVCSVCASADGSRLFSGSEDETIKAWDAATGACLQTLQGHAGWVRSVCLSADGSRLFSGSARRHDQGVVVSPGQMEKLSGRSGS